MPANVVLITTDQQRFDTTGPAAPRWLRTPHLDHLGREGVTFSGAYNYARHRRAWMHCWLT